MSEELFTGITSPVPDELWKSAQSPTQRQIAAVEFWNDMNGRKKEASLTKNAFASGPRLVAGVHQNAEAVGAAALAALMAGKSVYDTGSAGPGGVSREEASLLADMAQRAKMRELTGGEPSVRDRLYQKQLELAEYDRGHRGLAALRQGALGGAVGAGIGHTLVNPRLEGLRKFLPGGQQ
jgi:hypothetical protein